MSYSEDFRQAARSFNGQPFTKEELKRRLNHNPNFDSYFYNYQHQSYCGLLIVPSGDDRFTVQEGVERVVVNNAPRQRNNTTQARNNNVRIDYSKIISIGKNNGRFERLKIKRGSNGELLEIKAGTNGYIVALNKHNSDIVEYWIEQDSSYINFTKMVCDNFVRQNDGHFPRDDCYAILSMIRIIDIENSTNVWRFNRLAINNMVDYIMNPNHRFWERLQNGEPELVQELNNSSSTDDGEVKSLASKVCKYFAENDPDINSTDLFYINDSFVRHVLRFYCAAYQNVKKTKKEFEQGTYQHLFSVLDELHQFIEADLNDENKIDKSRFDHIMWYCYKNSGD